MTGILSSKTVARAGLADDTCRAMFALFDEYYLGATMEIFQRDLGNKDWVILLLDDEGKVQGFSTLAFYESAMHGKKVSVVFSGDTIIRREFRGSSELPRAWAMTVLREGMNLPQPLWWLLISSGYKTYRFLPLFYKEFYPRCDAPTPPEMQALIDHLAQERFGADYDAARGVVRFATGATPLRDGVAEIDQGRLQDPHVAFFVQANPGHVQGDELVCLARIHPDNFTAAAQRMYR
jgi:hypothetical protein